MINVTLYADAACKPNPGHGAWAVKLVDEESGRSKGFAGAIRHTSAPRAKMLSIIHGLEALKFKCAVTVFTDVQYFDSKYADLKANGIWKGTTHADLWKRILDMGHDLYFRKFTKKECIPKEQRAVKEHSVLLAGAPLQDTDELDEGYMKK